MSRMNAFVAGVAIVLAVPASAGAQAGNPKPAAPAKPKPAPAKPAGPRWEISLRGAFAMTPGPPAATPKLPVAGQTFTMADGLTPTRAVPTWFLGDGAAFMNQTLLLRGVTTRIDSLDVRWPVASRQPGPQAGGSIARRIRGGMWIEFAVDAGLDPLGFGGDARDRIEAARAAYERAFAALGASSSSVITTTDVKASADYAAGGRRLLTSGVLQYRATGPGWRPFLQVGMGYAIPFGGDTSVTLTGVNRFTTPSQTTIEETDSIRIRYTQSKSLQWITGGGMDRDLSRSAAFRIEARLSFGTMNLTGFLDTKPSSTTGTPGGAIVLNGTSPGLQFSSMPGIRSTLSGGPFTAFEVLSANKRQIQWVLSGAYVRRF